LSGRGLCDELITRPEESYRLCCVVVCDLETSRIGAPYIYNVSHLRVNHSLHLLHLIFAIQSLPCKTPAVVSLQIWTPFYTVPLFSLGNVLMEAFAMFIRDGSCVIRRKIKWGMYKRSFSDMLHPVVLYVKISSCTISM